MRKRLGDKVTRCIGYGHVGDGNLHLNMTTQVYDRQVLDLIEPFVYELTKKCNGSISAEHGEWSEKAGNVTLQLARWVT